jgi:hypothetical protein
VAHLNNSLGFDPRKAGAFDQLNQLINITIYGSVRIGHERKNVREHFSDLLV